MKKTFIGKKLHYNAEKQLPVLSRGITSKHEENFYCLNCFHSCSKKSKLKKQKDLWENFDYCYVEMPKRENKILKYNHGENYKKVPFIVYADV